MLQTISLIISFLVLGFIVFEIGFWVGRAQGVRDMRRSTPHALDGAKTCRNCKGLVGVRSCNCDSALPETPRK